MNPGGYTAEVTCLSPTTTEKDVHDFLVSVGQLNMLRLSELVNMQVQPM